MKTITQILIISIIASSISIGSTYLLNNSRFSFTSRSSTVDYITETNFDSLSTAKEIEKVGNLEADYYVATWGDNSNDGTSWENAFANITALQDVDITQDTMVLVNQGIYTNNFNYLDPDGDIEFKAAGEVIFKSVGNGLRINIGNDSAGKVTVNGVTIQIADDSPNFRIGGRLTGRNDIVLKRCEVYKVDNTLPWQVSYPFIYISLYNCYFHDISKSHVTQGMTGGMIHRFRHIYDSVFENIGHVRNHGFIFGNYEETKIARCKFINVNSGTTSYWGQNLFSSVSLIRDSEIIQCSSYAFFNNTSNVKNVKITDSNYSLLDRTKVPNYVDLIIDGDSSTPQRTAFGDSVIEGDIKIRQADRFQIGENFFIESDGTNFFVNIQGTNYTVDLTVVP
jgi:hypothetical protein